MFLDDMVNKRYIQFKHENETWLRTLDYFQQENIFLKNRIAQLAKFHINDSFLNELENFQNRFVDKDAVISLLRYDIALQNDLILEVDTSFNAEKSQKITVNQNKLRDDMQRMEREFNRLKFDFNNYLANNLQ
jgi:hypothetical protein